MANPVAATDALHLSDLLGKLYAIHRRDERDFARLTDAQIEAIAARSDAASFFRADAWTFVAGEIGKRAGISESRLAAFAGMMNVGDVEGGGDVAGAVAGLDGGLTPILLATLARDYRERF